MADKTPGPAVRYGIRYSDPSRERTEMLFEDPGEAVGTLFNVMKRFAADQILPDAEPRGHLNVLTEREPGAWTSETVLVCCPHALTFEMQSDTGQEFLGVLLIAAGVKWKAELETRAAFGLTSTGTALHGCLTLLENIEQRRDVLGWGEEAKRLLPLVRTALRGGIPEEPPAEQLQMEIAEEETLREKHGPPPVE